MKLFFILCFSIVILFTCVHADYDISQTKQFDPNYKYQEGRYCTIATSFVTHPEEYSAVLIMDLFQGKMNAYVTFYVFDVETILWCIKPLSIWQAQLIFIQHHLSTENYGF